MSGRSLAALTPAVREAIEWSVRLGSGAATAADRDAFEQWQALDASHRQAWQAVTQATHAPLNPLQEVPGSASAATRALRGGAQTKDIPVVLVTAKDQKADKAWGQMLGAKGYITKPFADEVLLQQVRALLPKD